MLENDSSLSIRDSYKAHLFIIYHLRNLACTKTYKRHSKPISIFKNLHQL